MPTSGGIIKIDRKVAQRCLLLLGQEVVPFQITGYNLFYLIIYFFMHFNSFDVWNNSKKSKIEMIMRCMGR